MATLTAFALECLHNVQLRMQSVGRFVTGQAWSCSTRWWKLGGACPTYKEKVTIMVLFSRRDRSLLTIFEAIHHAPSPVSRTGSRWLSQRLPTRASLPRSRTSETPVDSSVTLDGERTNNRRLVLK
jgi:hypothetical protein